MAARRIFSGIQPTGVPHLGNYLGAVQNWVKLQDHGQVLFSVVDLHALTVPKDPAALRTSIRGTTAALIACGVDPKRSILFQQSMVSEHSELGWILSCHTPLGWLRRMTQFKSKAAKMDTAVNVDRDASLFGSAILSGLFCYPTLMAADILLYGTTHVPVGEDQLQHVELTREIARTMNSQYQTTLFHVPDVILGSNKRVMSLRDGTVKMSKSDESDMTRINLDDPPDLIISKIRKAKTDSLPSLSFDPVARPEVSNLMGIYSALAEIDVGLVPTHAASASPQQSPQQHPALTTSQFKAALADLIIARLQPIRDELTRIQRDPGYIDRVLTDGAERARSIARPRLDHVRRSLGLTL